MPDDPNYIHSHRIICEKVLGPGSKSDRWIPEALSDVVNTLPLLTSYLLFRTSWDKDIPPVSLRDWSHLLPTAHLHAILLLKASITVGSIEERDSLLHAFLRSFRLFFAGTRWKRNGFEDHDFVNIPEKFPSRWFPSQLIKFPVFAMIRASVWRIERSCQDLMMPLQWSVLWTLTAIWKYRQANATHESRFRYIS
jgi:hypothetical protein